MDNPTNYRAPLIEPMLPSGSNIMRTPFGNVQSSQNISLPPPIPPSPIMGENFNNPYNMVPYSSSFGNYGSYGGGSLFGGYGMGGFGYGGFGSGIYNGGYGRGLGSGSSLNPYDPESRFIQLAEENSRPALESIGSLVSAVANIAAMLDSTFYAITSSFHAILGVAANFGRLRSVFSQFWQTFAIFRGLTWIYKKLLFHMKLSNIDPSSQLFKEAFEAAKNGNSSETRNFNKSRKPSPWPVILFIGFIFTAPYVVMKLLGNLTSSAIQESKDPRRWIRPIKSTVVYDFQARNPSELTIKAGQTIFVAPKEIQNTQKLLNSGWAIATVDGINSGLIPITYCRKITSLNSINEQQTTELNIFEKDAISLDANVDSNKISTNKLIENKQDLHQNIEPSSSTNILSESDQTSKRNKLPAIDERNELE